MQNTWNTSFAQFGKSIQQQMQQGFHSMGQQWQGHMDTSLQQFGQHLHSTMYQPIMTSLQNVQQGLHSDIDALSAQLGSLST
jgi:ribonucleotide reductase beta subunit family protein with ferritin-like domain